MRFETVGGRRIARSFEPGYAQCPYVVPISIGDTDGPEPDTPRMSPNLVPIAAIWGSVALLGLLTVFAWRQRPKRAAKLFAVTMFCGTWWATASALGLFASTESMLVFWTKVTWAGIAFVPVSWFLFALGYAGYDRYVTLRSAVWLSVIPTVTLSLAMTNSVHDLVYRSMTAVRTGSVLTLDVQFGPWFWVDAAYTTGLVLVGAVLVARLAVDNRDLYRDQVLALMLVIAPPVAGRIAYYLSVGPFDAVDPTPYTFILSGVAGFVALKRYRFLDAVPVTDRDARRSLVAQMEEGIVVVDGTDHVVETNPHARSLVATDGSPVGRDAAAVIPEYERIVSADSDEPAAVRIRRDGRERIYEVRVTDLDASDDGTSGAVFAFHDVTKRRTRLQRLDVLNRVLRHNLRNEMNVVYGYADQIENADEAQDTRAIAARIKEKTMAMVDVGDRAREIDEILEASGDDQVSVRLSTMLSWECGRISREHPSVTVEYDSPDEPCDCPAALETVVEILIEEVVGYLDPDDPTLGIDATVDARNATIAIGGNGTGIPASERCVVESGEETDLDHGTGLGLWLANWGSQAVGGDLSLPDDSPRGIDVILTVPRRGDARDRDAE